MTREKLEQRLADAKAYLAACVDDLAAFDHGGESAVKLCRTLRTIDKMLARLDTQSNRKRMEAQLREMFRSLENEE